MAGVAWDLDLAWLIACRDRVRRLILADASTADPLLFTHYCLLTAAPQLQALFLALISGSERSAWQIARAAAVHAPPGYLHLRKMPLKTVIFRRSALAHHCIGTSYLPTAPCFAQQ